MTGVEWISWGASILTGIAVIAVLFQLTFQNRQMHRDFELLYIQRYWDIMDRCSPHFALTGSTRGDHDLVVIRDYLQLCEDELDLRSIGRITTDTWREWSQWIVAQCREQRT